MPPTLSMTILPSSATPVSANQEPPATAVATATGANAASGTVHCPPAVVIHNSGTIVRAARKPWNGWTSPVPNHVAITASKWSHAISSGNVSM
nr:hypothetical protein [Pseudaminobacter manganicus]